MQISNIFCNFALQFSLEVMNTISKQIRQLYYDYRSELVFGLVLCVLMLVSYWLATFIPEDMYTYTIDPAFTLSMTVGCFWCGWLMLRHLDGNVLRRSWAGVLIAWAAIEGLMLVLRINGITAVGGTPDDPLFNASVVAGNFLAWLLFVYPTQVLRPGWLKLWKIIILLAPQILLGYLDYKLDVNLLPVILAFPVVLFFLVCRHIHKYRQWCENNFSSMDSIDVQWIVRYLIMLFMAGVSFYFICTCFIPNRLFTQQWFLFFMLMYTTEQVLFRPDPWLKLQRGDSEEYGDPMNYISATEIIQPDSDAGQREDISAQRAALEQWMEQDKPYLNPNFQLTDMRKVLPLNRTYLSQFINAEFGCPFYQFVNGYRVNEAKRLMSENPNMKIVDVATQAGFSSRTVFSSIFTKETGVSPSEWSKQQAGNVDDTDKSSMPSDKL